MAINIATGSKRNTRIVELRAKGESYAAIAKQVKLSSARVRGILMEAGVVKPAPSEATYITARRRRARKAK